ncbi:insulin-degrading enzyme-like isoform X2 [Mizuhopecten yessoensis]|uniref:insulin-degrading enzyme-like isoform X2 n=1 Tax=Mizuhopecten yessoensis TaxID=6573 RepID=UPI000B458782|nr:insulin-degrading enzyme-like isoform X2 [Mizuhopecten yessoensis]
MLLITQVPKSLIALRSSLKLQRCLSSMASKHVKTSIHHDEITKSPQDRRQYRGLELNNGLKVMVISDPDTDKSAAAMDINIGSMSDPWELPGLAHFCEHMLFLGTKKYEQENEYNKFLNENGGSSNAYTSGEHTNFYFDVAPDNLAGAMDRFAQFFLGPLFTASATEREINAVNSENDKNLQSDPWRLHQLDRSLAKPDHDYVKFGTGNKDSLDTLPKSRGQDVREELLKFHSKFYSSNIMALCILGKESLDELSDLVAPLLADVINKNTSVPEWSEHPYGPEQCKLICYALPVKDVRNLSMSWSIPDLHPYYTSNPGHYLGHLVGHEGPGSLLSELKAKGWVNTLCGGQSNGAKGFMFFKVDVDLTEEGIEHVDDIVTLTYQYINLLRKAGAQEWIFKECQDLSAMTFRFKDKEKPRNYASGLSGSLHDYPMTEALSGPYLLTEFRPDLINMILEKITPDNMRIGVIGKKFQDRVNEKEKWYGTEYMVEAIPEVKLQQWTSCGVNDKLKLPARNEFVPTIFDLAPREVDPSPLPEMAKDSALTRLWFKQDDTFLLPKACINFEISSPLAYSDPTKCNMTNLFVTLFKDALNEYAYDAELAGLHYDLNCTIYGMSLAVGGYNEKQDVLLRKIMEKLTTFKVDPKRFAIFKEMYARSMRNFQAEQPHRHAIYYTNILMSEVKWTNEELMHALEDITDEKVQAFIPELLSKLYLEGLIYGNFTKQKALEVTEMIEDILKKQSGTRSLLPSQKKHFRELQLPDGCYYMCEETNQVHKSSSIEIYYQCGVFVVTGCYYMCEKTNQVHKSSSIEIYYQCGVFVVTGCYYMCEETNQVHKSSSIEIYYQCGVFVVTGCYYMCEETNQVHKSSSIEIYYQCGVFVVTGCYYMCEETNQVHKSSSIEIYYQCGVFVVTGCYYMCEETNQVHKSSSIEIYYQCGVFVVTGCYYMCEETNQVHKSSSIEIYYQCGVFVVTGCYYMCEETNQVHKSSSIEIYYQCGVFVVTGCYYMCEETNQVHKSSSIEIYYQCGVFVVTGCYYMCEETNQVHKSSSIEIYYQCGVQQTDANMLLELFIQIIGEPCFDILRTKEQLGYIVFSGIRRTSGVQGMRIIVQSDRTPQYVENRVEAFLQSMEAYIKDMTDESFQKHVTALAAKRLEKPKKISGQQSRYWGEIVSQQFNFDRDDVEVVFLRGLKKNDVYNFYKDHICLGAPRRHKLSVHVMSTAEGTGTPDSQNSDNSPNSLTSTPELPQPIIVRNISDFKRDMALFPLPKPYIDLQKAMSKL